MIKLDYNRKERFQHWPNYHCAEQTDKYTLWNNMFSEFLKYIWEQPGLQAPTDDKQHNREHALQVRCNFKNKNTNFESK